MPRNSLAGILLLIPLIAGCSTVLAATPNLYKDPGVNPFAGVPESLQTVDLPLLYATDRKAVEGSDEWDRRYGWGRDRSIAFGRAQVRFGDNLSWSDVVEASRSSRRTGDVLLTLKNVLELGRVPETTYQFAENDSVLHVTPTSVRSVDMAESIMLRMVESRLESASRKDIFLYVHGYNNTFEDAALTFAQVWHFLGRQGVPFLYSWPAGSGGILRGYTHDRESGEYSVFHLKMVLRLLSRARGLNKIHVIAHSRGTDVFLTALREVFLEDGRKLRGECFAEKLDTVVLAAPDIDFDVLMSRVTFEGLLLVPKRLTIYVSEGDEAIGISNWLFSSLRRLGRLRSVDLPPEALERMRQFPNVEVVDARVSGFGSWGHDYFYANPAASSDLILLLRDGKHAGAEGGRPLRREKNSFWILDNDYPNLPDR